MELTANYTTRGNRCKATSSALPDSVTITRYIPQMLNAVTKEEIAQVICKGKKAARQIAATYNAKAWNF